MGERYVLCDYVKGWLKKEVLPISGYYFDVKVDLKYNKVTYPFVTFFNKY